MENTKESRTSILDMAMGAIKERTDYEMAKIIDNILDVNTPATKARELNIKIKFTPGESRNAVAVSSVVSAKIQPTGAITTMLSVGADINGEISAVEMTAQTPGQMNIYGEETPQPKQLRIIR